MAFHFTYKLLNESLLNDYFPILNIFIIYDILEESNQLLL